MEGLTLSGLLAFNAALLAAWAAPGPAFLVALRAAVAGGARAGMATGLGLAVVAAGWTLAALMGLGAVFAALPALFTAARILGALYLIWIAVRLWRTARDPLTQARATTRRAVASGMLVNLSNPKSVLFAAAVLVVVFPDPLSPLAGLAIAANHLALDLLLYAGLSAVVARPAIRGAYQRAKPALDRGAAVVLGALGLRLIGSR